MGADPLIQYKYIKDTGEVKKQNGPDWDGIGSGGKVEEDAEKTPEMEWTSEIETC